MITKCLKGKNSRKYILTILSFVVLTLLCFLVFFGVRNAFYMYLFFLGFLLGYYILRGTKFFSLWIIIVTSIFWSSASLILLSGILAIFAIPIREWIIYIPSLLLIFFLIKYPIDIEGLEIKPKRDGWIMMFFTVVSLLSHVFSVRGFIAPILHDPISHATWAKQIYDTGLINYFYSPGLHILAALGKMADGDFISRYILILTNIFNALIFIPVYLFIRSYFKDKKFALLSAALVLAGKFPSAFFWTMGKNALILGMGFMFLLFSMSEFKFHNRIKGIFLINALVLVLILIHYPVAFISLIGMFFLLIVQKGSWRNLIKIIGGILLGIVWGLIKMKYKILEMANRVTRPTTPNFNLVKIITFFKGIYSELQRVFFDFPFGQFILISGLLGFMIMILISVKRKKYLWFTLTSIVNILFMFLFNFVKDLTFLNIIYKTQILVAFAFINIGVSFLFIKVIFPFIQQYLDRIAGFIEPIIIFFVLLSNYLFFLKYEEIQNSLNLVKSSDTNAYEFMNLEIRENSLILNNAKLGGRKKTIVYASDSGAWIPVFTDFEIAMPFTDFASKKTHDNYEIYERIKSSNYTCNDIDWLLARNIKYYFKGSSAVFGEQLNIDGDMENFRPIFSEDSSEIYEIVSCY